MREPVDTGGSGAAASALPGGLWRLGPVGAWALLAAAASLITCYARIVIGVVMEIETFALNPHLQAVLMWGFAVVAVAFLWQDRARHGSPVPLGLGALAAATLIGTLYFGYDERVEAMAYVLLVVAALLNQNLLLGVLNRTVRTQSSEIAELNAQLSRKVEHQSAEIDRLERLKQFLPPQVADLVVGEGGEAMLDTHRRYIACVFCDIRNFTQLSEAVEPEDVIEILQTFHDRAGALIASRGGTIGFRSGDGLMVFFNDPAPCDAPVQEAVGLALEVRDAFEEVRAPWARLGHGIGLGVGIASGYATMGLVGLSGRADYTAIGGVVNMASRLCDAAEDGQVLLSQRAYMEVEDRVSAEALGGIALKGIEAPVVTYNVTGQAPG